MTTLTAEEQIISCNLGTEFETGSIELMALCPACKTFETVCLKDGILIQTRKFTQYGNHIYHDCGSNSPCRLYPDL